MTASPKYRIYSGDGQYLAAVREPDAALRAVSYVDEPGTLIRLSTRNSRIVTVWTDGEEAVPATDLPAALAILREREETDRREYATAYRQKKREVTKKESAKARRDRRTAKRMARKAKNATTES